VAEGACTSLGAGVAAPLPREEVSAPPGRLSLRRNLSWMSVGRGVFAATQWGVLAVLAKLSTPEVVGQFGLALAVCAPAYKLSNLGLRKAQSTDVRREHPFANYWRLRTITNACALLAVAAWAAGSGYGAETALVIAIVAAHKAIEAQSEVCYGLFESQERVDRVARSLMLRGPLALLLLAAGVAATGELVVGVTGELVGALLVLLFHDLRLAGRSRTARDGPQRPPFEGRALGRLARQTLPLGVAGWLLGLQQSIPNYFIAHELGLEALGFFSAMAYVLVAGNQFMMALGHSASARLARHFATGRIASFQRLLLAMAAFGVATGGAALLAVWLFGEWILRVFYTADYAAYADVFALLMGAALFRNLASLFQFGVTAARSFRSQAVHQAAVALGALLASALLVGPYGLHGAAVATVITYALDFAGSAGLSFWFARRRLRAPA